MSDYPHSLTTRPLTTWPGQMTPASARKRSPFSASLRSTLDTLDRELWNLSARDPILEVAIPPEKFRNDGHPRAGATADHPGVVLSLPKTSVGPLRYACDRFNTWQDNLRAIALGLEALRKVDRYGITKRGEQYAGFRQLPAEVGATEVPLFPTSDAAAGYLAKLASDHGLPGTGADMLLDSPAQLRRAWLIVAQVLHPDKPTGSTGAFQRAEAAKRMVEADHKQQGLT